MASNSDTTTTAAAREEVMKCEQEIHSIKAALRRIGSGGDDAQNSMEIVLLKVSLGWDGNDIVI